MTRITSASLCLLSLLLLPLVGAHADGLTDSEGRSFELRSLRGQVVALTFASPSTRGEAERINLALGTRQSPDGFAVVSVVDFSAIPAALHGYARRKMAESQRALRIKLLVDDSGGLRQPLGVQPGRRVDILIIDQEGAVRGRFRGEGDVSQALQMIAELSRSAPPVQVALR